MPAESTTELFRHRARAEAARYGSDPWVFVRELLQNARDAGARRIEIEVSRHGDRERVMCRDDGSGMSYEHARRYLFALYASSKEDRREQAGKFGIGFWSVLRFEPSMIVIRSRSRRASDGDAWQVSLDGGLERVEEVRSLSATDSRHGGTWPEGRVGTEIMLERPVREDRDLAAEVMAATRRYGRFLTRRDAPETPLPVSVNGRSANAELKLEAPCARFRGKGFRGAVGLGDEPRVELFAQGLFVRSASSLQDLHAAGELDEEATTEDVLAELPSLAPRVLIDSTELDLLLARSDARHDKHMRSFLRTAEKHLSRLITRQLQSMRPQPFYRLWWGALRDRLEPHLGWGLAVSGLAGLVLGLAVLWVLPSAWTAGEASLSGARPAGRSEATAQPAPRLPSASRPDGKSLPADTVPPQLSAAGIGWPAETGGTTPAPGAFHSYFDLADRYRGPRPDSLTGGRSRLAMLYTPADASPFFAALLIDELAGRRWAPSPAPGALPPYRGVGCERDCVEIRMQVAGGQRATRLPVPTGHRLDSASIRLDGQPVTVYETAAGEPLLRLGDGSQGVLEYRTGPARDPGSQVTARPRIDAPAELAVAAERIRELPVEERVQRALDLVAERVRYDRSPEAWSRYRLAGSDGLGFVEAALEAGAGDCDVQSGVLVTLLRLAGVEARLALGYVGFGGVVAPGLHAWVEFRGDDGGWSVADPSLAGEPATLRASGPASLLARADGDGGVRFPSPAGSKRWPAAVLPAALAAALLLAGGAWTRRRRGTDGHLELSQGEDLAALLGGALRHPEAFAGLPAMFHGKFVPLLGKRSGISLARARRLAGKNRLFRSSTGSTLARRAAKRRVPVIDASTAEGRVLSLALGAIDVDHWSSLLERSSRSRLSRQINRRLEALGAPWQLREASGLSSPWVEIALDDLGLGPRQIVVDPSHLEFQPVRALLDDHPDAAAFTLIDVLLHRLEQPPRERARVLADFAGAATLEASGETR